MIASTDRLTDLFSYRSSAVVGKERRRSKVDTRDVFASLADYGACVDNVSGGMRGDDTLDDECCDDGERPGTGRASWLTRIWCSGGYDIVRDSGCR